MPSDAYIPTKYHEVDAFIEVPNIIVMLQGLVTAFVTTKSTTKFIGRAGLSTKPSLFTLHANGAYGTEVT